MHEKISRISQSSGNLLIQNDKEAEAQKKEEDFKGKSGGKE